MAIFHSREPDPMLRRFERNQALVTLAMAGVAAVAWRVDAALAVIAGGVLMAISYRAIRGGVDAMMARPADAASHDGNGRSPDEANLALHPGPGSRAGRKRLILLLKFVGRYALLAVAAYVMLVCFRAHPLGLLVGAASPVVAVAIEAVRVVRAWSRPGQSR